MPDLLVVVTLFEADAVVVRYAMSSLLAHTSSYELTDPSGALLASVQHEAGRGLIGRLFSERPGLSAADLDVLDAAGSRMFGIAKARTRLGGLDVAVSLADGRPIGSATARRSRDITLYDPSDAPVARMRRDSAVRTTLLGPDGAEIGTVARELHTRSALAAGQSRARTYQVRFTPQAPVAVRILALAVVIAGSLQRTL